MSTFRSHVLFFVYTFVKMVKVKLEARSQQLNITGLTALIQLK